MLFGSAVVKSVKMDVHKQEITILFAVHKSYLDEAEGLAHYVGLENGSMKLEITPDQPQLFTTLHKIIGDAEVEVELESNKKKNTKK